MNSKRYLFSIFGIGITSLCLLTSCGDDTTKPDTTAPTVSITAPLANAVISEDTLIEATAADNVGVTSVSFYYDDTVIFIDSETPYEYLLDISPGTGKLGAFDSKLLSNGNDHIIKVIAADEAGNLSVPDSVQITVDLTRPTVAFTGPEDGATLTEDFEITVDAGDDTGISYVIYQLGASELARVTTLPFSYSFAIADFPPPSGGESWDWEVALSAVAYDIGGQASEPDTIDITLFYDETSPTIELTYPESGGQFRYNETLTATATDEIGITQVDFFLDDLLIGSDDEAPYELIFNSYPFADGEEHFFRASATDRGGNSASTAAVGATLVLPESVHFADALADFSPGTVNGFEFERVVNLRPDITYICPDELFVTEDICIHGHGATIDFKKSGKLTFTMPPSLEHPRIDLLYCVFVQGLGSNSARGAAVEYRGGTDGWIINNTFYDNKPSGLFIHHTAQERSFRVINNIFYGHGSGAGFLQDDGVEQPGIIELKYNTSSGNKWNWGVDCGCPENLEPVVMPAEDIDGSNRSEYPQFVRLPNPPRDMTWDLHLLSTSPCLNSGEGGTDRGALGVGR